jgi:small subunit ribosomal protein S20
MANIKSAKKRVGISAKKHERNRVVRSAVKTRIVRVRRITDGGEGAPPDQLKEAVAALDRAAERGIIHPNNAARRKSRLMVAANRAAALQADPEAAAQAAAEARSRAKGSGKSGRRTAPKKAEA